MIKVNYSIRPYIKGTTGQVGIKVRWNHSKCEVAFFTNVWADPAKWNRELLRAKAGSIHQVRGRTYSYSEINTAIAEYHEEIEAIFYKCAMNNAVPTVGELKQMVNSVLGRTDGADNEYIEKKTMKEMIDWFLLECGREKNWDDQAKEKYTQAFQHFTKANPKARPDRITLDQMYNLRDWYVKQEYRNRTINKQVTMLKGFLKWVDMKDGYDVPSEVLNFKTNLKVLPKTVTFLHYDELLHFAHFEFEDDISGRLTRARDFWCFMAFTSLRISDLIQLKHIHIFDGRIEMYAQKTGERLYIPLVEEAQAIMNRYKDKENPNEHVFDIPSAQKLNDAVKDAATVAGLDRIITDVYYIGTRRFEDSHRFYEIISNHDARRTFVSCSLAMGIPAEIVMKCTGHKDYNTMKPYIDTAVETQTHEMSRWNRNQYRTQIIHLLDKASESSLKQILATVREQLE